MITALPPPARRYSVAGTSSSAARVSRTPVPSYDTAYYIICLAPIFAGGVK